MADLSVWFRACKDGAIPAAEPFLASPTFDPDALDSNGFTGFALACHNGRHEMAARLLKEPRMNPNRVVKGGYTAMHLACRSGRGRVAKLLADDPRVDLNAEKDDGLTPLMLAAREGHAKIAEMLLKLGRERNVRPDAADVKGNTAFIYACSTSSLECIDVFLRHHRRVAVNVQNKDGETGLIVACVMGNSQVANDLLHYPDLLDLSLADNAGNTAFHHVCKNNDLELARSFLKHLDQVPVNAANRAGKTPRDLATGERLRALIDREVMLYERSPSKLRVDSSRVSYDRTKVLGKGGFGAVYRGTFKEEVSPGRFRDVEVAVKESLQGFADAKIRALFDKEVRVWTALGRGHDNVLKLLSYSEDPLVMVCQYANAGNLQEYLLRIAGEQDYYRRALQLLLGVAKGMAFIHASHVVHGDLKALNVLVDARPGGGPVPLIADFGMSRVRMQVSITMGQADAVEGTLGFLAPELLQGALDDFPTPRKAKKADVFAFAMVAYMVSSRGKEPFHDARFRSDKERMGAILAGQRPRPPADAPKGLVELMARCWAADPEKRPEFAEVVRDLDAVIAAAP